jgi:capsular exopolysaccharide synthesis family protein
LSMTGDVQGVVPRESRFQEYLSMVLRGKWIILASFILVTAAAALITLRTKPVYEASSLVLIDNKGRPGQLSVFDLTGGNNFNRISNELEILKSRTMAEAVAEDLLKQKYMDGPHSPIIPILQIVVNDVPQERLASVRQIAGRLLGSVVFVPVRDSDIIKIIARSNNPQEVAILANAYTRVYVERNMNASRTRSRAVREFLEDQLQARKTSLDNAELSLQQYMKSSGIVSLDGESNKVVQQLAQLEATRDGLEVDIRSRSRALASYKEEIAKQEPSIAKNLGESSDAYIKMLQEKLASLEVQRDVVIAQNPALAGQSIYSEKLKEIDVQITSLKKNLQERTKEFLQSIGPGEMVIGTAAYVIQIKQKVIEQQIELQALEARKQALAAVISQYEKQFNQIPERSIELAKLQRVRLSNEKLYLLVEEKFNEAAITEKSEFGYVDIVDSAIAPGGPVSPDVRKNIMLGALAGLALGVALVLLRSYLDVRVRTPEDLKRFGFVPLSAISHIAVDTRTLETNGNGNGHHQEERFDPHLVTYFNPLSPLAEAYRRLRTNVLYAQMETPLKSFLVTSANPSEGKSTTVANLAIAFAQAEKRVLLVDADMRRPTMHNFFGCTKNPGLTDLFVGNSTIEEIVNRNIVENLDIIFCGTTPPNPAELLGSKRMHDFIKQMSEKYDLLMFDSPPLLAVTDAAVLSTSVDGAILVASAGATRAAAISRASEFLHGVGGKTLGVLLNNFDIKKAYGGYYSSYSYDYYGYTNAYYHSNGDDGSRKKKSKVG